MIIVLGIDYLVDNKSRAIIPLFSFFSGSLVFYHYFLENYFISEKDFTQLFSYYMSMIYMLSGIFILIGYILKQEERRYYFVIFILTNIILILILYFWVFRIKIINFRDESQYLTEYDIYLHSKNLLLSITNKTHNREFMVNLLEYYSYNQSNFYKDLNEENDDYNLYLIVEKALKKRMVYYKNSLLLKLMHYMILKKYLKNHKSAYLLLYHLYLDIDNNLLSATFSQKFFIYRLKKSIEDDSIEFNYNKNDISMRYQINTLIDLITKVSEKYYSFWNLLLTSTQNKEIKRINEIGSNIHQLIIDIDEKFNEIKNIKQKNSKIYLLYGYYLRDILNDKEEAEKYLNIDLSKIQENLGYKNKNDFISSSDFQFIILIMNKNSIIIERISNEFCLNLGYSPNELIGKNIKMLFPILLKEEYEKDLIKKVKKESKNEKTKFFLKTKAKYLKVFPVEITLNHDEEHNYFLLCKIIIEPFETSNKKILNSDCQIITDNKFLINLFSSSSMYLLELNSKYIGTINISTLITEINDEILNLEQKFENNNLLVKFLRKLLKEKYINKENEIKWSTNDIFFILKCSEIIINGKLMGYYFNLIKIPERTEKRMTIVKIHNNLSEHILPNVKIPLKTKSVKKNSKSLESYERFIVDDSFIPKSDNEITFFPESKKYFFIGKDQSNNQNNIDNYVKKNILNKVITKKSTKYTFKKKFKKVTFSDDESSNSSISSSDLNDDDESENSDSESDVEISIEDYTKDEDINNSSPDLKSKSNIDFEEEKYYNVNLTNVLFFLYNFQKNSVIEIKNYEKISQIDIILDYERNIKIIKSNKFLNKSKGKNNNNNNKNNDNNIDLNKIEKQDEKREKIKIKKTKCLNFYSLIWLIIVFTNFIIYILLSTVFFSYCLKIRTQIISTIRIHNLISDLMEDSNRAIYNSIQLINLQNILYTNYYPKREDLKEYSRNSLREIYNKYISIIHEICSYSVSASAKNKKLGLSLPVNFIISLSIGSVSYG